MKVTDSQRRKDVMKMARIICPECRRDMRCVKNGIIVRYSGVRCYAGDRYRCQECGGETVVCTAEPWDSKGVVRPDVLLEMRPGE